MADYRIRIGFSGNNTYTVVAAQGSYSLTGQTVNLSYVPIGSNTITPSFTMSRSSGTAPVNVLFKAMATSTNVSRANLTANGGTWRQVEYSWDFGDPSSGTWPISGISRNNQTGGAIAAHVFDSGTQTHTVTLTAKVGLPWRASTSQAPASYIVDDLVRQNGNTYYCAIAHTPGTFTTDLAAGRWILLQVGEISASTTQTVTVTSILDATWAGGKYYVSTTGNYSTAPSGFTTQTTMPSLSTSNRVVMLRGQGESYGDLAVSGTNIKVVKDPASSTKPIVGRMTMGGTNSVIKEVNANKGAQLLAGQVDCLYLNNDVTHTDVGGLVLYFDPAVNDAFSNMVRPWFVGNTCGDTTQPLAGAYGAAMSPVLLGNSAGWSPPYGSDQQHSCRIFEAWEGIIAHNWWKGGSSDGIRHSLKLHGLGFVEPPTTSNSSYATGYMVVANNTFGATDDNNVWQVDIGPENNTAPEGVEYIMVENNTSINSGTTTTNFISLGRYITFRGNSLSTSGTLNISTAAPSNINVPANWNGPYFGA